MADQIEEIVKDDVKESVQEVSDEWSKVVDGKYKTPEDLAKAHKDLEKKIGELSKEVDNSRQFAQIVNPILQAIQDDKDIFEKLDKKLKGEKVENDKKDKTELNKVEQEVRDRFYRLIVDQFESKFGITKLPPDEKKSMQDKINAYLTSRGINPQTVDLRSLDTVLEDAYYLSNKDVFFKDNKSEDEETEAFDATIPSIKSSPQKGEARLTAEEAKVAEALGLTREQYLSGKK